MFVDTHCHLYQEYYESVTDEIKDSQKNDVGYYIVSGCDHKSNQEVIELVSSYPMVYGSIGIHPEYADSYQETDLLFLEQHIQDKKIVAIGEIGLDYHYTKENKEKQQLLFRKQLDLALKYNVPVVIHSRDATEDTIAILKEYPLVKGVIHSFSGSLETARIYMKMGYKLGINGVVTFKNSHLKELLPEILHTIVLETDSPYLTPHPYRGTKNSPKYIKTIALFISEYLDISLNDLVEITNRNIHEVFDISFHV